MYHEKPIHCNKYYGAIFDCHIYTKCFNNAFLMKYFNFRFCFTYWFWFIMKHFLLGVILYPELVLYK